MSGLTVPCLVTSPNSIFNSWDRTSSRQDIETAAKKIVDSADKNVQRLIDANKDSRKAVVDAVKDGSTKISDAVKRTTTTNAEQTAAPPVSEGTVFQESLQCIATATARVAEHIRVHPEEAVASLQSAKSIAQQFTDLTDKATRYSEESRQLREAAAEVKRASGWIGDNLFGKAGGDGEMGNGGTSNGGRTQIVHVGNSAFNALWERHGG